MVKVGFNIVKHGLYFAFSINVASSYIDEIHEIDCILAHR
jgi:hypothetical protein